MPRHARQRRRAFRIAVVIGMTAVLAGGLVASMGPASAAPTRYEAENATIFDGVVESNHLGFSGTGFVNYVNEVGSYVQWTVNAANAGTAKVGIRFSNGTTTDRPMDIAVNGTVFVDYTNVAGSYVEFTVNQLVAGTVILTFRYANGTTVNRPMDISVNSNTIANDMAFNPTTNCDTWA